METKDQEEVIVDDLEETNEEVAETTEGIVSKEAKPKRTPQEEYDYHNGRAQRLAKKLGLGEKTEKTEVKSDTSKPSELDMGGIAYLAQMVGLKGKAEIAIAKEYLAQGKNILDLPDNKFFKQDLQTLREEAESTNAIPKGKGRSGQTGTTDVDIAIAKYRETGEYPQDFATQVKLKNALIEAEKGSGPTFK